MSRPELLLDHADVRALACGRVIVTAWRGAPRPEVVATLEARTALLHETHPDGVALVIVPSRRAPDEAGRTALRSFLVRMGKGLVGAAVVLAVGGLKGKLLRGAATGAIAAMRLPFDVKLVGSIAEAAEHAIDLLRRRGVEAPSRSEIEELVRDACDATGAINS